MKPSRELNIFAFNNVNSDFAAIQSWFCGTVPSVIYSITLILIAERVFGITVIALLYLYDCVTSFIMERSGLVDECLTRERGAAGSSLIDIDIEDLFYVEYTYNK